MVRQIVEEASFLGLLARIIAAGMAWVACSVAAAQAPADHPNITQLDPHQVVGHEACAKCHASEVATWKATPHHTTFQQLHQKKEAAEIAKKMGITSIKRGQICIDCHYTAQDVEGTVKAISGVSCESCHGAAEKWVKQHGDYGGPSITKLTETPAHRQQRFNQSIALGMHNPHNLYLMAQSCLKCHTVPNEKLVNVGGHKAGSLEFEMVAWSQGMVRHNFLESNGKVNALLDQNRLRVLYVSGMIAELEFSLRATAEATEKATYGFTSAQRADKAVKRIKELAPQLNLPIFQEIVDTTSGVKLKLNNRPQLVAAADKIATLGIRFATEIKGEQLAVVDGLLPAPGKYKNGK